jgi:Amt family ammonium transporter
MEVADFSYIVNTMFILASATLIILMVPGFAMLEAGLVRSKNVTSVLTVNVLIFAVASMVYLLWGYNLMYGTTGTFFLSGIEDDGMSKYAMFFFQMAFVGKTINIMSGGVSGRAKILPLIFFAVIMAGFIYPTVGNWIWGGGFLSDMHDLAGTTVIHSVGGWAVLAAILIIGPRKNRYGANGKVRAMPASNIPLVTLGAFLLWIGWYGFNGGSQLAISSVADADSVAKIVVNTNTAGLAGAIVATAIIYFKYRMLDITMILNGALGGLVAITAAADVVGLWEPIVIGAVGGALVVYAVPFFDKIKIDDPVGAISVHLVNGIWGTIAVALFNSEYSMMTQLKGIVVVGIFTFFVSYIVLFIVDKVVGLRSEEEHEFDGLDLHECGVESYPEFAKSKV